ncbi:MAG: AtpZ/AtpI family protein [Oscillospiraceae bacterium]|nr:AtpZ/AtpI family protein [Oscillospiraceae bacterium]
MKDLAAVAKLVAIYGQLGFTIVTPPVVMALVCHQLRMRTELGGWVMVVGILLGLIASASGAYRFYRRVTAAGKKKEKAGDIAYYRHE